MRGFNTKESKLAEVGYICLGKSKRCRCIGGGGWNVPLVMTGSVKTLTEQPLNVKLGGSTGVPEFANCRRESRTVNGWCKNILVTKLWDYLLVTNVSKGFTGFPMLFQARLLIYSKTVNVLVASSDLNGLLWYTVVVDSSSSCCSKAVIGFSTYTSFSKYVLHHSIKLLPSNWYHGIPWFLRVFRSFR